MTADWTLVANFAVALLAIVNPVEKIPLWVEASKGDSRGFRWRLAGLVILTSAAILLVFLLFGRPLLMYLQIELASFKIGGGLILLQFGFSMLRGSAVDLSQRQPAGSARDDLTDRVADRFRQIFIPIGVPVIAGPGAITTAIIYGYQSETMLTTALLGGVLLGILMVLFLILLTGPVIQRVTGELPLSLISRIFGMILIAIAVQFMVDGLLAVFPAWAGCS